MHLHCHRASCVRDFGPLHAFWLYMYAFEQFNGLLGKLPKNNHAIETQLMQRFTRDSIMLELINQAESIPLAEEFSEIVLGHAKEFYSIAHHDYHENSNAFSFPPKYWYQTPLLMNLKTYM